MAPPRSIIAAAPSALVLLVTSALVVPPAATADSWRAAPSGTGPDRRARGAIDLAGGVGAVRTAQLAVRNDGSEPLAVRVTPVAARSTNGRVSYGRLRGANDPARWMVRPTADSRRTVPARTTVRMLVGVRLPSSATPGDHLAGVRVTAIDSGRQVDVPVRIRVDGPTRSALTLTRSVLTFDRPTWSPTRRGTARYEWRARNTGTTVITGDLAVRLETLFGRTVDLQRRRNVTVLPGDSLRGRAEAAAWPTFRLEPQVVVERERRGPRGIEYTASVGDRGRALSVVPVAQLGVLTALLVVALVAWVAARAVARRRDPSRSPHRPEDA